MGTIVKRHFHSFTTFRYWMDDHTFYLTVQDVEDENLSQRPDTELVKLDLSKLKLKTWLEVKLSIPVDSVVAIARLGEHMVRHGPDTLVVPLSRCRISASGMCDGNRLAWKEQSIPSIAMSYYGTCYDITTDSRVVQKYPYTELEIPLFYQGSEGNPDFETGYTIMVPPEVFFETTTSFARKQTKEYRFVHET